MTHLRYDLRFARRSLGRRPGWTLTVVLTLGLGIGATTAIFSLVDAVLLRPLAFPEPERLVTVWESHAGQGIAQFDVSPPAFAAWRRGAAEGDGAVFDGLAASTGTNAVVHLDDRPRSLAALAVSPGFFRVLGVEAAVGRTFLPDEEKPGNDAVAVLTHDLAGRLFGAAESASGRSLEVGDRTLRVVGVLPSDFELYQAAEIFLPLTLSAEDTGPALLGARYLQVVGRLRDGVSLASAQARLDSITAGLAEENSVAAGWSTSLVPFQEKLVGEARPALLLLLGAVALLLLIVCANVAGLFLARGVERQRELAIRGALGAPRRRLVAQLLTESLVLALAGGSLGLLVASWALAALVSWGPFGVPRLDEVGIDLRALAFSAAVAMAVGVATGLAPALAAVRGRLTAWLRDGGRALGGPRRRLRPALVVAETALAVVLLIGAGLLGRSFFELSRVDPGFRTDVTTLFLALPEPRYAAPELQSAFVDHLVERLAEVPGIAASGATTNLPLSGSHWTFGFSLPGEPASAPGEQPTAEYHAVSPDTFLALGIPVTEGRSFSKDDGAAAPGVAIVNEAFARRFLAGRGTLGRRLATAYDGVEREIVGIVGDVHHSGLDASAQPEIYVPLAQNSWRFLTVAVRAEPGVEVGAAALREAVWDLDPELPVDTIGRLDAQVDKLLAPARVRSALLGLFATSALFLTALGLYGVLSYSFRRRTREVGLRVALGARQRDIHRQFLGEGLRLLGLGTVLGLAVAVALGRFLAAFLYGVGPRDPLTFAAMAGVLVAVGLLASWQPARRASVVDPVVALRSE